MELRDSSDLACSEIRAASLVDCADAWWFLKRMCVRNRAIASVAVNFPLKVMHAGGAPEILEPQLSFLQPFSTDLDSCDAGSHGERG